MRQGWILALVGVVVFAAVGVATLPASLLLGHLPKDLAVEGVSGTVWNGAADALRLRGAPLGALSWRAEPAALLKGELAYQLAITHADGFVRGRVAATFGGALQGTGLELALPITALHPEHADNAWAGRVDGHIEHARLEDGWPVALVGTFVVRELRPPGATRAIGTYAIDFDGRIGGPTQLVGRVRDLAAPLLVRGQLAINRDRSYKLEGEVTPRPEADPEVRRAVAFLGSPDASGRRSFEILGTF